MKKINLSILALFLTAFSLYAQDKSNGKKVGQTVNVEDKNIDWEYYDASSTVSKNDISFENIQGLWSAYDGVYKFGERVNAMKLTKPFVIEIEGQTYRRSADTPFISFTIKDNIITKINKDKIEIGIINKITPTELTITWKDKENYTRYMYKK